MPSSESTSRRPPRISNLRRTTSSGALPIAPWEARCRKIWKASPASSKPLPASRTFACWTLSRCGSGLAMALVLTAAGMDGPEEWSRIIAAAKAGDHAAFESLMRQYERLVLATALRLLGNMEDAQDAAQEVFLRLHRNLGKVESQGNFA